jgi:hypothetical protein
VLLLLLIDVDPLLLQLQLLVVLLPLAGMGTDNRDIASIEGITYTRTAPWVGGTAKEKNQ